MTKHKHQWKLRKINHPFANYVGNKMICLYFCRCGSVKTEQKNEPNKKDIKKENRKAEVIQWEYVCVLSARRVGFAQRKGKSRDVIKNKT